MERANFDLLAWGLLSFANRLMRGKSDDVDHLCQFLSSTMIGLLLARLWTAQSWLV